MDRRTDTPQKIPVKLLISVADDSNDSAAVTVKSPAPLAKSDNKFVYAIKSAWTIVSMLIGNYRPPASAKPVKTKVVAKPKDSQKQTVEIRIILPAIFRSPHKQAAAKFQGATVRNKVLTIIGVAAVISLVVLGILSAGSNQAAEANAKLKTPSLVKGTPKYNTVLPAGKNINDLGGWTRISPPGRSPVYTYVDSIGGTQIDVSEQPLPARFKTDTDNQIEQLAHDFSANDRVMAGDTPFYVGTSENGPQSVIFTKSNLLILIKSTSLIRDSKWADYIKSLN